MPTLSAFARFLDAETNTGLGTGVGTGAGNVERSVGSVVSIVSGVSVVRVVLLLLSAAVLLDCSNLNRVYHDGVRAGEQLGLSRVIDVDRRGNWVLPVQTRIHVAAGDEYTADLDYSLGEVLTRTLGRHFPRVIFGEAPGSLELAQDQARANQADYLLYPTLLVWQDADNSWSSLSERFVGSLERRRTRLQLALLDVRAGTVVDTVLIDARSGLMSFSSGSATHLMDDAIERYADSLAGVRR